MMILRIMRCLFCQIFNRQVKRSYTPGNTEDKKGNTGCDTDDFMVIPVVIQVEQVLHKVLQIIAPNGAYMQRVLGGFCSP